MAANTDLLKKLSRRWVGQIGAAGVSDNTTATIPLSSVTNLATDTAVVATIDRVDANGVATPAFEETIIGVVSGSNLANSTRGVEGTAQAHNAGAVVEILVTAKGYNDIIDWGLIVAEQTGRVKNEQWYAADAGANDTYVVTLSPVPTAYTTGMVVNFKANTANTGACTLNVNSLGAKSIKKLHDQDPADNDIESGQVVTVVYDGTNFQMQSQIAATPTVGSTDGWTADTNTWTWVSSTSFKVTGVDVTATFTKGTKLRCTNSSLKYFYVTSSSFSSDTTVNITGGTDYTLANAAITANSYSYQGSPQGFPDFFTFLSTYGAGGSMTIGSVNTLLSRFSIKGRTCFWELSITGTLGGTTSNIVTLTVPVAQLTAAADNYTTMGEMRDGAGTWFVGKMQSQASSNFYILKSDNSNIVTGASFIYSGIAIYEI